MRQVMIGAVLSTQLIVSGCSDRGNAQPFLGRWTIDALNVNVDDATAHKMHGTFEIRQAQPGERGIAWDGSGGACLIAHFTADTKACRQDSECNLPVPTGSKITSRTWTGYCVGSNIHTGNPAGSCWVRPSDDYCKFGASAGASSTPEIDTSEVYAEAKKRFNPPLVTWRVLGCVNGVHVLGETPPCKAAEKMYAVGDAVTTP